MATKRTVMWFRNDLRIFDNPTLTAAAQLALKDRSELSCVYCFDPRHFGSMKFAPHKTGIYRSKFLIESVANLRENLRSIGGDLLVAFARPEDILPQLASSGEIFVQAEVTSEEIAVERKVEKRGGKLDRVLGGNTLHHPEDLPYALNFKDLPAVFTNYRQQVEKVGVKVRPLLPSLAALPKSPAFASITSALPEGLRCGYDYLPTLTELGFTDAEIAAYTQATATSDVLHSLRILSTLQQSIVGSTTSTTQSTSSKQTPERSPPQTATSLPQLAHPSAVMTFTGGETSALQRLQCWMFDNDHLKDYFDIRNGMLGEGYSSKLSPWLALGCISPRHIYHESKRYERERGIANKSTYWLTFELMVRDFYRFYCAQHGAAVFYPYGPMSVISAARKQEQEQRKQGTGRDKIRGKVSAKYDAQGTTHSGTAHGGAGPATAHAHACTTSSLRAQYKWSTDDTAAIARWKAGQTGQPLVDANMRELLLTGWMSNRGRQNVASYLIHDLHVDWRVRAMHFEEYLLDHDVCSNYGNWNAAAGLSGEGKRVNKFKCVKQSADYDPVGRYLRHWLPELRALPAPIIYSPTAHYLKHHTSGAVTSSASDVLGTYGVTLGVHYPFEACLLSSHPGSSKQFVSYAALSATHSVNDAVGRVGEVKDNNTNKLEAADVHADVKVEADAAGGGMHVSGAGNKNARSSRRQRKNVSEAGGRVQHDDH